MQRGIGRRFDDGGSGVKYLLSQAPADTDTSTFIPWAADYLGRYLLPDSITSKAILALGLRGTSLTNSAAGPMIRARRSSDNEERDFYAHEIGAGGAIEAWAGAGDAFVVTDYSAIGTNHATQSTAASQPKCVAGGVWLGLQYSSTPSLFRMFGTSAISTIGTGDCWCFAQLKKGTWASGNCFFFETNFSGNNRVAFYIGSGATFFARFTNSSGSNTSVSASLAAPTAGSAINLVYSLDRDGVATIAYKDSAGQTQSATDEMTGTDAINVGDGNSNAYSVGPGVGDATCTINATMLGTGLLTSSEIETLLNYPFPA